MCKSTRYQFQFTQRYLLRDALVRETMQLPFSGRSLARSGIDVHPSTLADWVSNASFHLRPVVERLSAELKKSDKLFMDETTIRVLDPGRGKTRTGYLWTMARDERSWGARTLRGGEKLTYSVNQWPGLLVFLYDGRVEIDFNPERTSATKIGGRCG